MYDIHGNPINTHKIFTFDTKLLCIGDSLTEGDYGSEPAGTKNVQTENYPYFLNRFLDVPVTNAGACGYTASGYWDYKMKNVDPTGYSVAVIMLGTNGGLTDTVEADTAISAGQTYNDYANTNTGAYCKIIEYLMANNPDIQIVLCTCPYVDAVRRGSYATNTANANHVIPKIAEKYKLPVFDVRNELGVNDVNTDIMQPIDGLHGGQKFYSRLGTYIGSKIISLFSYTYPAITE